MNNVINKFAKNVRNRVGGSLIFELISIKKKKKKKKK